MSKYLPLKTYLAVQPGPTITLDFNEMAQLVDRLPPSAHTHREWWANTASHVQAAAWLSAGWEVARVDFSTRTVEFTAAGVARARASGGSVRGKKAIYLEFWTKLLAARSTSHPDWPGNANPTTQSWVGFPTGRTGLALTASFAAGSRLRSEFKINMGDSAETKAEFSRIEARREELEAAYGRALVFEELPTKKMSRIADYRADSNVSNADDHAAYIDWFLDGEARFRRAIVPFLTRR